MLFINVTAWRIQKADHLLECGRNRRCLLPLISYRYFSEEQENVGLKTGDGNLCNSVTLLNKCLANGASSGTISNTVIACDHNALPSIATESLVRATPVDLNAWVGTEELWTGSRSPDLSPIGCPRGHAVNGMAKGIAKRSL